MIIQPRLCSLRDYTGKVIAILVASTALFTMPFSLLAQTDASKEGTWNVDNETVNPVVGSKDAVSGGTMVWGQTSFASGLNYLVVGDVDSSSIFKIVVETLCDTNPKTAETVPVLAEKWQVAADKKSILVHVNKAAKYPDGSPVLAKDFKTFWDLIQNPKHLTAPVRAHLESVEGVDVIDDHTLNIRFSRVHFSNMEKICSFYALKTDYWNKGDFNKDFNAKIMGSGPYEVANFKRGEEVTFKRRKDYWGWKLPLNVGRYNFDRVVLRKINDDSILFEMFKKGEIDMFRFYSTPQWKTETDSEHFKNNWVVARRIDTKMPKGFGGMIINMRRPGLNQLQVRKALTKAFDRDRFIRDIYFNSYAPLASYFPNSIFTSPNLKPSTFDLKAARDLLAEAGFSKVNDKGILVNKDGQALQFTFLYTQKLQEKYLTIYKDDLKKIGIDLNLEQTTWATLTKKLDTFSFDFAALNWSGSINPDPTQLWLGKYAAVDSSSNYPGLNDPELDQLIESSYPIFDRAERAKVFHKIDEKIAAHVPYNLFWFIDYNRIGYQNKIGYPEGFMPDFVFEWDAWHYAWHDEAKAKAWSEARKNKTPLPATAGLKGPQS
jgi:microcin C transport system substrate-binding protein